MATANGKEWYLIRRGTFYLYRWLCLLSVLVVAVLRYVQFSVRWCPKQVSQRLCMLVRHV